MPPALPVVRVNGPGRNVGKTWLAAHLIGELRDRGYRVAAVKRSHHPVMPDRPGTDSDRFAHAGAAVVLFCGSDGTLERSPVAAIDEVIERYCGRADIAIVEGFKDDTLGAVLRVSGDGARRVRFESMDGALRLDTVAGDLGGIADAIEREYMLTAAGDDGLRHDTRRAARLHGHLCAGVVLGVRMARFAIAELGLSMPLAPHALRVTVEQARCATDAIAAVTGCAPGHGDLRVVDYGKMAATFEDTRSGRAVRVIAREDIRDPDATWAPTGLARHHRQSIAYRLMPDAGLFSWRDVRVVETAERSRERMTCVGCGETAHVPLGRRPLLCEPCAGGSAYYESADTPGRAPDAGDRYRLAAAAVAAGGG